MRPDAMLEALRANGPHPAVAARMHLFGQFVGSWDVDVLSTGPNGQTVALIDAWRSTCTWIGPVRHLVRPFIARRIDTEIVLKGSFAPGALTRWIFSDIEAATFRWRNIESHDEAKTVSIASDAYSLGGQHRALGSSVFGQRSASHSVSFRPMPLLRSKSATSRTHVSGGSSRA